MLHDEIVGETGFMPRASHSQAHILNDSASKACGKQGVGKKYSGHGEK